MKNEMLLARRRILLAKQSGEAPDMVLLINSPNTGDFSVTTNYGTFTAVKVSDYPYYDTTVTHKLSISGVTFSTGQPLSGGSSVRRLFVGVESWGTSNTYTNASNMFYGCPSLTSIPASWQGLAGLTDASSMFLGCTSLTSIPESWEGLWELTDASSMFYGCTSLASIPPSWAGLGKVTNVTSMFRGCTSLASIPPSWAGLGKVTSIGYMFIDCTALTNCGTMFTGLAIVTDVSRLFHGCTGMQGNIHALYVYLSTKPIAVSGYSYCFRSCTQAVGYSSIPSSWR